MTKKTSEADNFYNALKDDPEEILKWCESEIEAYKELVKLIEKGRIVKGK